VSITGAIRHAARRLIDFEGAVAEPEITAAPSFPTTSH